MTKEPDFTGRRALAWAAGRLGKAQQDKEAAQGEARALLSFFTGRSGLEFLLSLDEELEPGTAAAFRQGVARRLSGQPMQYILGSQLFMERDLLIRPGVLIPRWDTEVLVRAALARLEPAAERKGSLKVLELGVGSGAVLGSLAAEIPELTGVGVDLAPEALALAGENFRRLGVEQRLELRRGSWFEPIGEEEQFEAILSNPPYITTAEMEELPPEVRAEPKLALWGGPQGLDCYGSIVPKAWPHLPLGGWLLTEIGWRQGQAVAELFQSAGFQEIQILPDAGGRDRVVLGRKGISGS